MSGTSSFGSTNRYYAGNKTLQSKDAGLFDAPKANADVREVLAQHKYLQESIERTVKRWSDPLRKLIRDETGLKFTGGNERQAITLSVVDGLPLPLARVFEEDSEPLLWEMILNNAALKTTLSGLKAVEDNFGSLAEWRRQKQSTLTIVELQKTKALVAALVEWLESLTLKERLANIDEDVLGAYFFRKRAIQIYWMAISIVARMIDVSIEALTVVVLTHELIHAYTHLGNDHDGEQWPTGAFADADSLIIEGLAQFYTAQVCKRIEARVSGVVKAFEELSTIQAPAYNCHSAWTNEHEPAGEIVRFSMISCRKRRLTLYQDFLAEIGKVRERVGHQAVT